MMAVNFTSAEFKPRVVADKVALDDYEVTNLISSHSLPNNGFMCERFVRTPVNVTFHFPFNIDISYIIVDTAIGAQRSTGLQIFTHSIKERKHTWFFDKKVEIKAKDVDMLVFQSVGRKCHPDSRIFNFVNKAYRPRSFGEYGSLPLLQHIDNAELLNARRYFYLSNASYLTVRIIQTASGSVPCLKSVQIWGQPAVRTSMYIIKEIFSIINKRKVEHIPLKPKKNPSKSTETKETKTVIEGVDIPPDFIDPITCDLMSLPIMLPSGYTVDQSTLDKHNSAEEKWGRSSSDPFTGVKFTADHKPVINVSLKARIDQFVLTHSDKLKKVPRSLGTNTELNQSLSTKESFINTVSKRKYDSSSCSTPSSYSEWKKLRRSNGTENPKINIQDLAKPGYSKVSETDDIDLTEENNDEIDLTACEDNISDDTIDLTSDVDPIDLTLSDNEETNEVSHEQKLKNSLDSALDGALSQLPSFTTETKLKVTEPAVKCLLCDNNNNNMYSLPCGKHLCRNCLTSNIKKSVLVCTSCSKEHPSNTIEKVHL